MRSTTAFLKNVTLSLVLVFTLGALGQQNPGTPTTLKTFQVLIDRDANPNTGFDTLMNDGTTTAVGVELLLTVTVNAGPAPMVVMVEAQQWDGNTGFSPPYFTDASGWPVGTNNGISASDVVEAYMPLDRLGITQNINLFIQSGEAGANFDVAGPAPFMFGVPIPTLGQWMLVFYIGLFLIAALWFLRRQRRSTTKGLLALFAASVLFGATCNIILDGQIGDWVDPPLVTDPVNDAGEDAVDILAFYNCYDNQNLYVRFDVEELENQSPTPDDQSVSLLEDDSLLITLTATDVNGDPLVFAIDTNPTSGTLGAVMSTGPNAADVTYTPNGDFNGADTFTFLVDDQNGGTAIGTVDITVDPVNDVPSFTAGPPVTVSKDTGPQTIAGWATAISAGPANEAGQNLTFMVNVTSNPQIFATAPTVDPATGDLNFTPDADASGTATVEFFVMDDGGTANGGVDTSTIQTVDLTVDAVNDAPSFTAGADQTHNEDDGAITVNAWATAISAGPPDETGQMLTFNAAVTSDPGSIFAVAPVVDTATGNLTYTLAANAFGIASIDVTLMDDGGTANGGVDTSAPQTLTITVNEVNDAPSFTNAGNVNVFKGGSTETIAAWATMLSTGPANEAGQAFLGFNVVVTADPDDVLGNLPTIDPATGNLVFDTTADNNGTATLSITLQDDGGTANGGVDTSTVVMIDIIVGAVNDAPSFTAGANQTHNEDDGAITVNGWATAISAGPPDEAGQMLTFAATVTSNPGSIFAVAPAIDAATGDLTYTLAADAFGVAMVDITLMDDGGTANGGVDTSAPQTLTITVNEVNDAPNFTNSGNVNVFKGGSTETIPAWASALSLGPANEAGQAFLGFNVVVTADPNNVLGNLPTIDLGTGNLVFNTTADNNGTATLSITLQDDGGTANGGVDTSAVVMIDITVGAVNDAPSFTAGANQTHNEDDGAITVNGWATAISAGPPDEAGQMLTFNATVNSNPGGIFAVAPAIDAATGNLTYTLAADAFGVAMVDVSLMDDGGTANGGVNTSASQTLVITVNEVNDAPSFNNSGDITVASGGNTETTPAWATMLSLGPANESTQNFTGFSVMVTSDPNNVLGTPPTVDTGTGDLSFDTNMNDGVAMISITLMDDGGTANGGVDTSAVAMITITVNPPNAPPVASDDAFDAAVHTRLEVGVTTAALGHKIAGSVLTSGTPDSDPDAGTMLIVTGTSNLTPGAILNMNADGTFTLIPPPNTTSGTITFDYTISDQHPTLPMTDTATVTITLFDPVWFVKNDHPGPSQGTSENPFQTLAEAEAASAANHKIFVFTGDGTTTGHTDGFTMKDGQSLIGERANLVLDINGTMSTIVTGSGMATSAPRIGTSSGVVVTLADDNLVRGLILLPTPVGPVANGGNSQAKRGVTVPSAGIFGGSKRTKRDSDKRAGGTTVITEVVINPAGTSNGLALTTQTGNFSFTNSEITGLAGSDGIGLLLDSSSAAFTFDNLNISNLGIGAGFSSNTSAGGISLSNTAISGCAFTAVDVSFENTDVTFAASCNINQTTGGSGVTSTGGNNTYSFNGPITVNNLTGVNDGIRINGVGANPTFNFAAVTINATSGQHGVLLQTLGGTSDINFNGVLDINGAGAHGLLLFGVNGTVDITQASSDIADAMTTGVRIDEGAPQLTYQGTLTNNSFSISMTDVVAPAQTFFGGTISQLTGQATGINFQNSAGTHEVASANLGTMANRLTATGININTCTGIFRFTNFNIFSSGLGLNIVGGLPTVNILPASTTASINATATAIQHGAGSLTGSFTNVVANTTAGANPGIRMFSPGGGTVTFGDVDVDTTTGLGIEIDGYNTTFTAGNTATVNTTTGRGLILANGTYAGQIDSVIVTGGTNGGVDLSFMNGSLDLGLVTLTTTAGIGFRADTAGTIGVTNNTSSIGVTGNTALLMNNTIIGTNNMAFASISASNTGGTNEGIDLDGVTGGTMTVGNSVIDTTASGGIGIDIATSSATFVFSQANIDTATDKGIDLTGNPGGTFTFSNADIDTTTGNAFEASGGGTVTATGTNTIDTTSGRGVILDGTIIGAANFTLQSINTNGAINGIRLNNTGTSGGLIVTGTGGNDSGGNIQNSTADAVSLNNTVAVSLTDMQVNNSATSHINAAGVNGLILDGVDFDQSGFHGINGNGVTALNMTNCTLDRSGNVANEHGMRILNLLGNSNITTTDFMRSSTIQAFIQNTSASVAAPAAPTDIITFDGCSFSMPVAGTFGDNISVEAGAGSNMRVILDDAVGQNTFVGGQDGAQLVTATGGTLDVMVDNVDVQTVTGVGVNIGGFNASDLTFDVRNIDTLNTGSMGINATSIGGANMSGIIDNNIINGSTAGQGIQVITEGNGDITVTISNNDIDNIDAEHGIRVQARAGSGTINATIDNNDVNLSASPFPLEGIYVESGSSAGGDTNTICLNMLNNTSVSNFNEGFRLRHRPGTTFNLQNFVGVGSNPADVTTWVNTTKSNTGTVQVTGTGFTVAPANCPTPP